MYGFGCRKGLPPRRSSLNDELAAQVHQEPGRSSWRASCTWNELFAETVRKALVAWRSKRQFETPADRLDDAGPEGSAQRHTASNISGRPSGGCVQTSTGAVVVALDGASQIGPVINNAWDCHTKSVKPPREESRSGSDASRPREAFHYAAPGARESSISRRGLRPSRPDRRPAQQPVDLPLVGVSTNNAAHDVDGVSHRSSTRRP